MEFKTVQDAFNHYRNASLEDIEKRAAEIKGTIDNDPDADVTAINVEIEGLNEAKKNIQDKQKNGDGEMDQRSFNPITGMSFKNEQVPTDNIFESAEYRSAFFKTMLGQDLSEVEQRTFNTAMNEQRASGFNTTGNSSAVLPTQTLNEVISKARKEGGLLSVVRNFNLPSNISVPIGKPTEKAAWHTEGTKVDAEQVQTARIKFESHEVMKVFSMSISAKQMTIQAFESYLVDELTSTVLEAIEDAIVNGDGDGKGKGLLEGIEWTDDNTVDFDGSYNNFTDAMAKLKRGYAGNARFVMNNATLYGKVYGLTDKNGRPLFIDDAKNESIGRILGKQVVVDDHMPDDTIVLGDFNYYGVNMPQGVVLETSRESNFRSGLIDYRAVAIADCKPLVDEAFVKLSGADNGGDDTPS
ncbi:phage major capsid protein [Lentibacillus sp. L22]|uniref:phage major capsid protein n=1 Tax=Lentibacillus sp. L22 TaxID=3163028 RepID=UPI003465CEA9